MASGSESVSTCLKMSLLQFKIFGHRLHHEPRVPERGCHVVNPHDGAGLAARQRGQHGRQLLFSKGDARIASRAAGIEAHFERRAARLH